MVATKGTCILPKERRKAERFCLFSHLTYRVQGKSNKIQAAFKNISGTGLRLRSVHPLKLKNIVLLAFSPVKCNVGSFKIAGRVVWRKQMAKGEFEYGIRFLKITNKARFIEFLCEQMLFLATRKRGSIRSRR